MNDERKVMLELAGYHVFQVNGGWRVACHSGDGRPDWDTASLSCEADAWMVAECLHRVGGMPMQEMSALSKCSKAELVALAVGLDIDPTGTKADLTARVQQTSLVPADGDGDVAGDGDAAGDEIDSLDTISLARVKQLDQAQLRAALLASGMPVDVPPDSLRTLAIAVKLGGMDGYVRGGTLCPQCRHLVQVTHVEIGQYARVRCRRCDYRGKRVALSGLQRRT